jgi:uncharacterized metal-binding protein
MPGGSTHAAVTLALVVPTGIAVGSQFGLAPGIESAAGCLACIAVNPDLDMVASFLPWRVLWWPYRAFIPHRSLLSHGPIIGTLARFAYLYGLYFIIAGLAGLPIVSPDVLVWVLVGLGVGDLGHIACDALMLNKRRVTRG